MATVAGIFLQVCLPLIVTVLFGVLLDRRFGLNLESLVKLNLYLLVPAFIFVRLLDTPLAGGGEWQIMAAVFATLMTCGLLSFVIGRMLCLPEATQKAHALACMLGNSGNFGIPLITLAFGKAAAAVQVYVLVTMNVSTFTVGMFLANARFGQDWRSHGRTLIATLRQPSIYAVAAAVLCRTFGFPVTEVLWIWQPLHSLADALIGMALITLGVQLSQTQPARLGTALLSALGIRLIMGPVIAFFIVMAMKLPPSVAAVIIVTAGAPTAVNTALLAHEFGGDRSFATTAVYYSTVLGLLTVTLSLRLIGHF